MSEPQAIPPAPADGWLAQADAVLARFPAKAPDKAAARQAAEEVLVAYAGIGQPAGEASFAAVRLLRALGRYEEALVLLRDRHPDLPGRQRAVLFQEMELCMATGRMTEAERLLEQLQASGPMRPSWLRSIERLRAKAEKEASALPAVPAPPPAAVAEPPPEPVLVDPSDRTQPLLARVLALNERFPVREAHKYAVRAAAEGILADYRAEAQPSDELTYALIRMLRALKRYPAALELMAQRRPAIAQRADEIDFLEIELHLRSRQREAGEALLAKFTGAGRVVRPSWKRTLAKLARKFEVLEARTALEVLQQGLSDLSLDVDIDAHLPLLRTIMPAPNEALEVLLFLQARLQGLRGLDVAAEADLARFDKYHRAKLIFTCGFSWSGSGAVSCFLMQHKQVSVPFGTSEMAYLQGRDGRRGIFPFLLPGELAPEGMRRLLATFFMESIVSNTRLHYSPMAKCMAAENNRIGTLGELVDDFNAAMLSGEALRDVGVRRRVMASFLQRLFSVMGGTHVLLNNVFLAPRTILLGAMEDALFVVVERDARDQYIARKIESGHAGDDGVEKFGAMLLQGRSKFQAICQAAPPQQLQEQLWLVRFEDFLRQPELRSQLLQRLGLAEDGLVPDKERFDPRVSLGNVGIHEGRLTPAEHEYLERELGFFMQSDAP